MGSEDTCENACYDATSRNIYIVGTSDSFSLDHNIQIFLTSVSCAATESGSIPGFQIFPLISILTVMAVIIAFRKRSSSK